MFTVVIRSRPPRPWVRVVILIVVLLVISRVCPDVAVPLGLGSWIGWLSARPAPALRAAGIQGSTA